MYAIWRFFVTRASFGYLVMAVLVGLGTLALITIPKESSPEVQVPVGIVSTFLPGASALDVEKLLTNPIEERLATNLEDLNTLTSTSRESVSVVVAEFNSDADIDASIRALRDEVDLVRPELPREAEDPVVSEINFVDQPVITIAISGDIPAASFTTLAERVEDELTDIPGVSRVGVSGARDRAVHVIIRKEALETYDIRLVDVLGAIASMNATLPVGAVTIDGIAYSVAFDGDIDDARDIEDIALFTVGDEPVYVRDIALVSDGLEEAITHSRLSIGGNPSEPSVSFDVFKRRGGDITSVTEAVTSRLAQLQEPGEFLENFDVLVVFDTGEFLKEDLTRLSWTGLQTVLLVMVILLVALGWREALVAGVAIPLSFVIAFIALEATGNTLNFVSLFALILVVGILVDSAIVIVEGIHTRMKAQMGKQEAVLDTIETFQWPLISGTFTTVAVFIPLFLISGVTGEFIASIPFTVIFVLLASLFVALALVPLVAQSVLRRRITSRLEEFQEALSNRLQGWYRSFLSGILGDRTWENVFGATVIVLLIVAVTLPIFGLVEVIFFPPEDLDFMYIEVELPQGTILSESDLEVRKVEEYLYGHPEIESFVTTVGQGSVFNNGTRDTKIANIFITLRGDRSTRAQDVAAELRDALEDINSSTIRVSVPDSGPPVGPPIVIKFTGDDLADLSSAADRAAELLSSIPGTTDVVTSTQSDSTEFVLTIDRARAAEFGLSAQSIAQTLRTAIHGATATTIKTSGDDIDVVVRLDVNPDFLDVDQTNVATVDDIRQIRIATQTGSVLLGSLVDTNVALQSGMIAHEDRERVVTVESDIVPGANARTILAEFNERAEDELEIPDDVSLVLSGENDETEQSFRDMFRALVIGIALMLAILVLQFNSFRYAFYVILIVPFTLIGILFGLMIAGKSLSFPSMMGFIALAGIVVNNSIILIDSMNRLRRERPLTSIHDVVVEGAVSRLRPILLTTLTTVIGLIPLIFSSELWAPLAYAVIFGLTFSVLITLILVPILYRRWPGKLPS